MRKQANKTPELFSTDQDKRLLEAEHYSAHDSNFTMSEDAQDLASVFERKNEPEISYQILMESLSVKSDN